MLFQSMIRRLEMKCEIGDQVKLKKYKDINQPRNIVKKYYGGIVTIKSIELEAIFLGDYYLIEENDFAIFESEINCLAAEYIDITIPSGPIHSRFEILDIR